MERKLNNQKLATVEAVTEISRSQKHRIAPNYKEQTTRHITTTGMQ
jgi:hypothetical protein